MTEPTISPLKEASIEDIIDELKSRADHVVVIIDGPIGKPKITGRWTKNNDIPSAIGLCFWAALKWSDRYVLDEQEGPIP